MANKNDHKRIGIGLASQIILLFLGSLGIAIIAFITSLTTIKDVKYDLDRISNEHLEIISRSFSLAERVGSLSAMTPLLVTATNQVSLTNAYRSISGRVNHIQSNVVNLSELTVPQNYVDALDQTVSDYKTYSNQLRNSLEQQINLENQSIAFQKHLLEIRKNLPDDRSNYNETIRKLINIAELSLSAPTINDHRNVLRSWEESARAHDLPAELIPVINDGMLSINTES